MGGFWYCPFGVEKLFRVVKSLKNCASILWRLGKPYFSGAKLYACASMRTLSYVPAYPYVHMSALNLNASCADMLCNSQLHDEQYSHC